MIAEGVFFRTNLYIFSVGYCSERNLGVEWNMQSGRTDQHAGVV